jgi:hypothetical protein
MVVVRNFVIHLNEKVMNTIKIGARVWQVEFDDDNAVGKQITEIIRTTRDQRIDAVLTDLPGYVRVKHRVSLSPSQVIRLSKALTALRLENIQTSIFRDVVLAARNQPFTCMSVEPFYAEIDRTIHRELNNPQLPLALGPVSESTASYLEPTQRHDGESLAQAIDISQLPLALSVTD